MNILDIEAPLIAAVIGPARLHTEFVLLADIILATPSTVFQDEPHFASGIVPGDGVHLLWQEAIGPIRGRYFILTHQELDAQTAKDWGTVNEIVAGGQAPSPRTRDCRGAGEATIAHHEVHAHRAYPETATHHRRRRHFGPGTGGHQRGRSGAAEMRRRSDNGQLSLGRCRSRGAEPKVPNDIRYSAQTGGKDQMRRRLRSVSCRPPCAPAGFVTTCPAMVHRRWRGTSRAG
jgi:enoyl-CoA hydratase/carnithine racemase